MQRLLIPRGSMMTSVISRSGLVESRNMTSMEDSDLDKVNIETVDKDGITLMCSGERPFINQEHGVHPSCNIQSGTSLLHPGSHNMGVQPEIHMRGVHTSQGVQGSSALVRPGAHTDSLKPFDSMPGPKGLPLIGNLWSYIKKDGYKFSKMFEAMQDLSRQYGPVYKESIGLISHVVISDPVEYSKVVRVDGRYPHRVELEPMVHYKNKRGMPLGTVNSQGEEWHKHRIIVAKKTLRPKEITEYIPAMNEVANDFIVHMKMTLTPEGHMPKLDHAIFKWALESIGTFLFDERIGCLDRDPPKQAQEFLKNLVGFFRYMQPLMYNVPLYKYYPTATWRKYEKHADAVTEIGMSYIHKRVAEIQSQGPQSMANQDKVSLLTYFLTNGELTPTDAISHALDVMMGGVETTANSVLWTLLCLANNPRAQDALYQEIRELLPNKGQVTPEKIAEMQYVKAAQKETFRLYPITFATSRFIHEDIELGGYHVPAGTHCQANLYGMGRDPALFSDPMEYRPERWLRENHQGPGQTMASLPWGHGARMCLGRRLAEQEIYMAVIKLMQNFEVRYDGPEIEPVLYTVMTPDKPVKLQFIPRT